MNHSYPGPKVKEFRTRKGMSQEVLAEESGLSHRTIQRIENGESNPTGDTLKRLAGALGVGPDELIDWTIKEDRGYLVNLNLSALAFIPFPLLGILIPFIMWSSKKGKLKGLDNLGRDLINFQINWTLLLIIIPLSMLLLAKASLIEGFTFRSLFIFLVIMYLLNVLLVVVNSIRISNGKEPTYISLLRFIR